ncbi:bifunctional 5,10-methylenetetrahydrofolate dehydrogenase/5,10-methenyltetrahydrofolate cyclohydrolase [Ferrimonas aestuarii]|uniref:Bifunctional protein FolD n=1 Tax=Ferrimonas aestuarii TaxID=2569539 RepID=A0A4V5NWH8_9GAMM|nr:bifunctional 5,10-methylenetetrahydrofolate dehydrogenase/5,10-methenyltetrahydrofolate cyclohydrolase [Ferrimonas aestuarii]TKB57542.1 bifunctional 5,10-methylenetetrahydrofolate dehydrogenase/5,10-methenyltetrahydrofolate cyclohydrolase [Ferrimonas aestuarii]
MAKVIDGKAIADAMMNELAVRIESLKSDHRAPALAVVLVGSDAASEIYVRNKIRRCEQLGVRSIEHRLPETTQQSDLLGIITSLNNDEQIDGILVQMPLPTHIDEKRVLNAIRPDKDVDGFHPVNVGRLSLGEADAIAPCTPQGCVTLAKSVLGPDLSGKRVAIVGRSNIVGKPAAALFLAENCTVQMLHSKTESPQQLAAQADILVVAAGRAHLVDESWVKPGAVVIDVGINRVQQPTGSKLLGDVDFDSVTQVAAAVTPVPGGVGPMTIAYLLHNTFQCYLKSVG